MAKMTSGDFQYYKSKIFKDRSYHEKEFLQRIDPDLIDSYYEGFPTYNFGEQQDYTNERIPDRISINALFPATSTLIAQFYPQNPQFVGIPKRKQDDIAAKVAAAAMNYYYDQMLAIKENQKAIISAWMYGIGITKQGWRTEFRTNDASGINQTSDKTAQQIKKPFTGTSSMEEIKDREYIASEGPFLEFVNAKNIYFDSEQPFGKGRFFTQKICKNLNEIKNSKIYTVDDDFIRRFKRGKDERNVEIELYESWIWMPDGLYVFVMVDGYSQPLRWDKTPYASEGFPYKVLALNTQVNRLYPISHMKVAQRLARFRDYILTLQKEHIEKHKNISVFDGDAFDPDDRARIKRNEIGLNLFTKKARPAATAAAHIGGNTIPQEMFAVADIVGMNIKEILTVVGARQSGESEAETATQEKIADFGNQLRAAGMQEQIKDFLIDQGKKLLQDLKQFGTAPAIFKITGLDLTNPNTGLPVTEEWIEFATSRNPELLKDIIPAEMDIGLNVSNTLSRDLPMMRKQIQEFVQGVVAPLIQPLAQEGKKFNAYKFVKKMAENFEGINDADEFFDNISSQIEPTQPTLPQAPVPNAPAPLTPPVVAPQLEGMV